MQDPLQFFSNFVIGSFAYAADHLPPPPRNFRPNMISFFSPSATPKRFLLQSCIHFQFRYCWICCCLLSLTTCSSNTCTVIPSTLADIICRRPRRLALYANISNSLCTTNNEAHADLLFTSVLPLVQAPWLHMEQYFLQPRPVLPFFWFYC